MNQFQTNYEKEFIGIRPLGGLGSRLLCIASFQALAEYLKYPLYVYWTHSKGFNETKWFDLFQTTPCFELVETESQWEDLCMKSFSLDKFLPHIEDNKIVSSFNMKWLYQGKLKAVNVSTDLTLNNIDSGLICKTIPNYDDRIRQWIWELVPETELQQQIYQKLNTFDTNNTIGIHIRRNDALKGPMKKKILQSNDQYFEKYICKVIHQKQKVYLATDDSRIWNYYQTKYKDSIVGLENIQRRDYNYGDVKHGQKDALVDMYCLSNCVDMIGTNYSNFSLFCKYLNRKEKMEITMGVDTFLSASSSHHVAKRVALQCIFIYHFSETPLECIYCLHENMKTLEPDASILIYMTVADAQKFNIMQDNRMQIHTYLDQPTFSNMLSIAFQKYQNVLCIPSSMLMIRPFSPILSSLPSSIWIHKESVLYSTMSDVMSTEITAGCDYFFSFQKIREIYSLTLNNFSELLYGTCSLLLVKNIMFDHHVSLRIKSIFLHILRNLHPSPFYTMDPAFIMKYFFQNDYPSYFKTFYHIYHFDLQRFNEKYNLVLNESNAMKNFERFIASSSTTFHFLSNTLLILCTGTIQEQLNALWNGVSILNTMKHLKPLVAFYPDNTQISVGHLFYDCIEDELKFTMITSLEADIILKTITYISLIEENCDLPTKLNMNMDSHFQINSNTSPSVFKDTSPKNTLYVLYTKSILWYTETTYPAFIQRLYRALFSSEERCS